MSSRFLRLSLVAAALSTTLLATTAQADSPPIKPGLWEMTPDGVDNARMAAAMKSLQNMPPEQRAKIETMMKAQGVDMSTSGSPRVCIAKESLNDDAWMNQQGNCKTQILSRSASVWKWHSTCDQPASEADGEALFTSTENYTIHFTSKGAMGTSAHTIKMAWKGSSCGDLKPVNTHAR